VRVLLKGDDLGDYQVLIEDDGNGFVSKDTSLNAPGEHIGLTIMEERAQRIGGNLKIESELGEGTHVMLSFSYISSDLENS
jgi:two-component system nitrate/nitrite sensor histidine kinase NarX